MSNCAGTADVGFPRWRVAAVATGCGTAAFPSNAASHESTRSEPNRWTKTTPSFRKPIFRAFQLASNIPTAFMTKEPRFRGALKLREACEYLGGLSVPTIHRLIKRGLLTPNRSTRHLIFPIAELERFLICACIWQIVHNRPAEIGL